MGTGAGMVDGTWPGRNASETFEQQQDSSPGHAKRTPKNCLTLPLETIEDNCTLPGYILQKCS